MSWTSRSQIWNPQKWTTTFRMVGNTATHRTCTHNSTHMCSSGEIVVHFTFSSKNGWTSGVFNLYEWGMLVISMVRIDILQNTEIWMTVTSPIESYLFDKILTPYKSCPKTSGFLQILLSLKIKKSAHK